MSKRFCVQCKTATGGFSYCPKCGERTEILKDVVSEKNSEGSTQAALWCHLAPLLLMVFSILTSFVLIGLIFALILWVPPLIIKSQYGDNEFVVRHAKSSFNFQIYWLIVSFAIFVVYLIGGILTLGIGLLVGAVFLLVILIPLIIVLLIFMIRASMAASSGKDYEYPLVLFKVMK